MFGGGRCFFVPRTASRSCRRDDLDLRVDARARGWTVAEGRAAFDALGSGDDVRLPLLQLFADDHMSFEVDRDSSAEPSLAEMTRTALRILDGKAEKTGFFLMVEGSRIDMAGRRK